MPRYKVSSGDFEIVLEDEGTFENVANLAIQIHDESNSLTELNAFTMIEDLGTGEVLYIGTQVLINNQTAGFGANQGQYMRKDELPDITKFRKD